MLHCPRCSSGLLVHHLLPHQCATSALLPPDFPPPKCPTPPAPRHHYQNVGPPVPPRVPPHPSHRAAPSPTSSPPKSPSPALKLMQQEAALKVEMAALQMAIAEKQLEQSRLQQQLLNHSALATPAPAPAAPWFSNTPAPTPAPVLALPRPAAELEAVLERTQAQLEQSGWYYGALTWQESAHLLQDTPQGTFLVRDSFSKDPVYRYSLSVQRRTREEWVGGRLLRAEGPTSVRIQFVNGEFRLDADDKIRQLMPLFPSVGHLVSHYLRLSSRKGRREVLIEQAEEAERGAVSGLLLCAPLLREPPALSHLARLAIHHALDGKAGKKERQQLQIPSKLQDYLNSYPLDI